MANSYLPPQAKVSDNEPRRRLAHAFVATLSSVVTLPAILFSLIYYYGINPVTTNLFRPLATLVFFSLLAGAALVPFRPIRWYWAIVAGPALAIATMTAVFLLADVLGLLSGI